MSPAYALAPYVGRGTDTDAYRPRQDHPWWRAIDLRPDGSRPEGYALLVTPERVRERGVIDLGDDPDARWSLRSLASRLGVTLSRGHLRHAAASLLLDGREDGTRWRPIWPERDGVYRIWLGGLLWEMPVLAGGATFTETWTHANSASLTADQSWTEIQGTGWGLGSSSPSTTNQATIAGVSEGVVIARCNTALATEDHGATLALVTFTYGAGTLAAGPLVRKANDAVQTFYYHQAFRDATFNEHRLVKRITGTATQLGSSDTTDPAGGTTLTVEASGSSITAKRGGSTTVGPITDSAITTGLNVGLFGFSNNAGNFLAVDNFTAADLGSGQIVTLPGPAVTKSILFDILPAVAAPLGLVVEEDVLFDLTPAADLGQPSFTETGTAADGPLVLADQPWTRLGGGTRWQIASNQLAFIGNGFGADLARCDTPLNSEHYRVTVPFDGWQLNTANDISLGVIVSKDHTTALTCYAIFMTQTPTHQSVRLSRYLNGTLSELRRFDLVMTEGQALDVVVRRLAPPTTRISVRVGGVQVIDQTDDLIPSGRYVGVVGYLQGVFIPAAVLRLGTITARTLGPAVPPAILNAGMAGAL